jgi:hypothetical protein
VSTVACLALSCAASTRPGIFNRFFDQDVTTFTVTDGGVVWPRGARPRGSPSPELESPVHPCDRPVGDSSTHIDDLQLSGDFLRMLVSWGGGCGKHKVDLCFRRLPATPDTRVELEFSHRNEDPCEAVVQADLVFPLRPLRDAVRALSPNAPRRVTLVVRRQEPPPDPRYAPPLPDGRTAVEYAF